MKLKCLIALISSLLIQVYAYAQEVAPIQIQKMEGGRTVAIVPGSIVPRERPTGFAGQSFYLFETSILKTARFTSSYVGKITDGTVLGVQKGSHVVFFPVIKALDVRRWTDQKQTSSRDQL